MEKYILLVASAFCSVLQVANGKNTDGIFDHSTASVFRRDLLSAENHESNVVGAPKYLSGPFDYNWLSYDKMSFNFEKGRIKSRTWNNHKDLPTKGIIRVSTTGLDKDDKPCDWNSISDGDVTEHWFDSGLRNLHCAEEEANSWVEINLRAKILVQKVNIYASQEAKQIEMNLEIRVGNIPLPRGFRGQKIYVNKVCGSIIKTFSHQWYEVFCASPILGQFVTLQQFEDFPMEIVEITVNNANVGRMSECTWTDWKDKDDPDETGDDEIFGGTETLGQGCNDLKLEARVKGSENSFKVFSPEDVKTHTEDIVELATGLDMSGLSCSNDQQADGACEDYEVRFCCAPPFYNKVPKK